MIVIPSARLALAARSGAVGGVAGYSATSNTPYFVPEPLSAFTPFAEFADSVSVGARMVACVLPTRQEEESMADEQRAIQLQQLANVVIDAYLNRDAQFVPDFEHYAGIMYLGVEWRSMYAATGSRSSTRSALTRFRTFWQVGSQT